MELLIGDKIKGDENIDPRYVDFDSPIKMSLKQRNEFIKFLRSIFAVVEEDYVNEFRNERLGDKIFGGRKWTIAEYELILQMDDTAEIAKQLGRTWMSVHIQRGKFIFEFNSWLNKNRKNIINYDLKKLIYDFLEFKKKENSKNKKYKQEIIRKIKKYKEVLKNYESIEQKGILDIRINMGLITKEQFDKQIQQIKLKIKELEKKLEKI